MNRLDRGEDPAGRITRRTLLKAVGVASGSGIVLGKGLLAFEALAALGAPLDGMSGWTLQKPAASPPPRAHGAIAHDALRGNVVVFGGVGPGTKCHPDQPGCWPPDYFSDTWLWDGMNWARQHPNTSPGARAYAAMAFDGQSGESILFGGLNGDGNQLNDTWSWNGKTWAQMRPATAPPPQVGMKLTYDESRKNLVLFDVYGGTWLWTDRAWIRQYASMSPSPRGGASMTYDSGQRLVVLFGGFGTNGSLLNDTWTWDGRRWTPTTPRSIPEGRSESVMVFDAHRGKILAFSGRTSLMGASSNGDVWSWDGASWSREAATESPGPREGAALVSATTESGRGGIVLFGGKSGHQYLGDTWTITKTHV
jgi:hypothetical protein